LGARRPELVVAQVQVGKAGQGWGGGQNCHGRVAKVVVPQGQLGQRGRQSCRGQQACPLGAEGLVLCPRGVVALDGTDHVADECQAEGGQVVQVRRVQQGLKSGAAQVIPGKVQVADASQVGGGGQCLHPGGGNEIALEAEVREAP